MLNVGALNKFLPPFVWDLNQRQSRVLLDALIIGDGHRNKINNQIGFFTSSKRLADDVQKLALHAGWSGSISVFVPAGTPYKFNDGHSGHTTADILLVSIIKTRNWPTINTSVQLRDGNKPEIIQYDGIVSCVEVPSHVFYMRENGISHWTGNSSRAGQNVGTTTLVVIWCV